MFTKPHKNQKRGEASGQEFLVFRLGDQEYGIDILKVQEIRGYDIQSVTSMANCPSYIKGVINLRGTIVPIVDLRLKLNLDKVEYNHKTVVVILSLDSRVVGVVADGVSDVLMLEPSQISPAPSMGGSLSSDYLLGLGTVGERMLILLDIEKFMDT